MGVEKRWILKKIVVYTTNREPEYHSLVRQQIRVSSVLMAQVSTLRVAGFFLLFLSVVVAFDMSNDAIEATDDSRTTYHLNARINVLGGARWLQDRSAAYSTATYAVRSACAYRLGRMGTRRNALATTTGKPKMANLSALELNYHLYVTT
ncbi:hypothetical protein AKJ16_DCAP09654 [Drosera capensis]